MPNPGPCDQNGAGQHGSDRKQRGFALGPHRKLLHCCTPTSVLLLLCQKASSGIKVEKSRCRVVLLPISYWVGLAEAHAATTWFGALSFGRGPWLASSTPLFLPPRSFW